MELGRGKAAPAQPGRRLPPAGHLGGHPLRRSAASLLRVLHVEKAPEPCRRKMLAAPARQARQTSNASRAGTLPGGPAGGARDSYRGRGGGEGQGLASCWPAGRVPGPLGASAAGRSCRPCGHRSTNRARGLGRQHVPCQAAADHDLLGVGKGSRSARLAQRHGGECTKVRGGGTAWSGNDSSRLGASVG